MKNIFLAASFLLTMNAFASIEFEPTQAASSKASDREISRSRACFQELSAQGCGDPGEDPTHFRSCMRNVKSTLTSECKALMNDLYGKK
jgi:hypothetical protein